MSAAWPALPASFEQPSVEASVERVFEATRALRALRAGLDLARDLYVRSEFLNLLRGSSRRHVTAHPSLFGDDLAGAGHRKKLIHSRFSSDHCALDLPRFYTGR